MSHYGYLVHSELYHYGIKGMKWGIRRYQNPDGSLTEAGKNRYKKQVYNLEKRRKLVGNINEKYYTGKILYSLATMPGTLGLSVIPGIAAAQKQIKNDKKIDDHYDKKLSELRNSTKESNKLESELYNSNSKFKKMRDTYNDKKKLERDRLKMHNDWVKEREASEKLLNSSYAICNSKTASSAEKVKAFKKYMENAMQDDDHGGLGKPGYSTIYSDRNELMENIDWLSGEFGLTLTDAEKRQVLNSYSKYFNKPIHAYSSVNHSALSHHGILGQKWGVRRYQNEDGSLTEAGKKRYLYSTGKYAGILKSSAYGGLLGPGIDTSKYYEYERKQMALKEKNAKKISKKEGLNYVNKGISGVEKIIKGYGDNAFSWEDVEWYAHDNIKGFQELSQMQQEVVINDIIEGLKKKGYYNYD